MTVPGENAPLREADAALPAPPPLSTPQTATSPATAPLGPAPVIPPAAAASATPGAATRRPRKPKTVREKKPGFVARTRELLRGLLRRTKTAPTVAQPTGLMSSDEIGDALCIPETGEERDRMMAQVLRRIEALLIAEDDRQKHIEQKAQSLTQASGLTLTLSATVGGLIIKDISVTWAWWFLVIVWVATVAAALLTMIRSSDVMRIQKYLHPSLLAVLDRDVLSSGNGRVYERFMAEELTKVYQANRDQNRTKASALARAQRLLRWTYGALVVQMVVTALAAAVASSREHPSGGSDVGARVGQQEEAER